ncbi:MAG: DUF4145 domain-containing protein [Methylococcaceae bacterium]
MRGDSSSYALFFADPTSAANPLRSALECFLDESSIIKERNGKNIPLHQRLQEFKKSNGEVADLLGAVKWLGNDGSHVGQELTEDDLLKGYKVFLHAVEKCFDDPESRVKAYAAYISKGRGL